MPPTAPVRPRPVTWSGWVVLAGSVLVLWSSVEVVAGIGSLETRKGVEEFLSQPPGGGLGVGVEDALGVLRVTATLAAACAIAAAILGWHVLRRSRSARVGLSVLAAPLFITGTATGGLISALVVAAIVSLWLQPARAWFDGHEPEPGRTSTGAGSSAATSATDKAPVADRTSGFSDSGFSDRADRSGVPRTAAALGVRPAALVAACLLTLVTGALALAFCAVSIATLWLAPDLVAQALREQEAVMGANPLVTVRVVQVVASIMLGVVIVWTVIACVLAAFALRGRRWARTALVISAAVAGAGCALAVLGSVAFVVPLSACVVTGLLLMRADVRAWPGGR